MGVYRKIADYVTDNSRTYTPRALVIALTKAYHARGLMLDYTCRYNYKTHSFWWKPIKREMQIIFRTGKAKEKEVVMKRFLSVLVLIAALAIVQGCKTSDESMPAKIDQVGSMLHVPGWRAVTFADGAILMKLEPFMWGQVYPVMVINSSPRRRFSGRISWRVDAEGPATSGNCCQFNIGPGESISIPVSIQALRDVRVTRCMLSIELYLSRRVR